MKLIRCALILLCSSYLAGQGSPANNTPPAQPATAPAANQAKAQTKDQAKVLADGPVITIPGICQSSAASTQNCETVVTRTQFDSLSGALSASNSGTLPAEALRRLALQYGEMLVFAKEAEKRGLDKEPATQSLLDFARMQVLAQRLLRSIREESRPSLQEIQKYYDENSAKYQGIAVQRVMIPLGHSHTGKEPDTEALKALAEGTRKRLVAGEDPAKLEQEIYDKLGFKHPPATALVVRPSTLAADQRSVAKLKAGEVSEVFSEPSGLLIYKSDGEKPLPLDRVREEVQSLVEQQKIQAATEAVMSDRKPVLNGAYFEEANASEMRRPHSQRLRSAPPSARPAQPAPRPALPATSPATSQQQQ